jgi:hypothetical protein
MVDGASSAMNDSTRQTSRVFKLIATCVYNVAGFVLGFIESVADRIKEAHKYKFKGNFRNSFVGF